MKKALILIIVVLMNILIPISTINAKTNINASISTNTLSVKEQEKLEIILKLDNFEDIGKGINAYKAKIEYDKNIFEKLTEEDFGCLNKWEKLKYNPKSQEFVAINKMGAKEDVEVAHITFRVKKGVKASITEIKFTNIVTSEGKKDLNVVDESIKIIISNTNVPSNNENNQGNESQSGTVIDSETNNNDSMNETEGNNENNPSDTETKDQTTDNNSSNTNESKDQTKDNNSEKEENESITSSIEEAEKTSVNYMILFLIIIIELAFLILYLFWRKNKDQEGKYKNHLFILVLGLITIQFIGTTYAALYDVTQKGELNGDKAIDYQDLSLLEEHLIHLTELKDKFLENADINCDDKITVTDLTLLVQKLERKLEYKVEVSNLQVNNRYPQKNEEITFSFETTTNYGASIEKVIINNEMYIPEFIDNSYTITLKTGNNFGIKNYSLDKIILDNGKEIKIQKKIQVDVLKESPSITNYYIREDINNAKVTIFFELLDKDDSITNAFLEVRNSTNNEILVEKEIQKGQNTIEIPVEEYNSYEANFIIDANLDSDKLINDEDHHTTLYLTKEFQFNIDYEFHISETKLLKNGVEQNIFEKNEVFDLMIQSTNNTIHNPSNVKINGKSYEMKDGIVSIPGLDSFGEKELKIEEVILENGKVFEVNQIVKLKIKKDIPKVEIKEFEESIEKGALDVKLSLQDAEKALQTLKIVLLDEKNQEISQVELTKEELENQTEITKTLQTTMSSKYKIQIVGSYVRSEGTEAEKLFYESEIKAKAKAKIINSRTEKTYYEKEEILKIIYEIETNQENIEKITINEEDYIVNKNDEGNYEVEIKLPKEAGVKKYLATKVKVEAEEVSVSNEAKIEILKSKPNIKNYKQQDQEEKGISIIEFEIEDIDQSFESGKVIVTKLEDNSIKEETIKVGKNHLELNLENAKEYRLEVMMTYDRDTNTLSENENKTEDEIVATYSLQMLYDYDLSIDDITTTKENQNTIYFNKGEKIDVSFKSSNLSIFEPQKIVINGNTYDLKKVNDRYHTEIEAFNEVGIKEIKIEKIILSNEKEFTFNDKSTSIDILKDELSIKDFAYERTSENKLRVKFNLVDEEKSLVDGTIQIINNNNAVITSPLKVGENVIETEIHGTTIESYFVIVNATYDLDSINDSNNHYENVQILNKEIVLSPYVIELKEVTSNELYHNNEKIEILDISNGLPSDIENYYVKVSMKNLPTYYAKVREFQLNNETKKLKVIIDQTDFILYQEENNNLIRQNEYSFDIIYQDKEGIHAFYKDATSIFEAIQNNLNGKFILEEDLDASNITTGISGVFKGTLDGNGHKIINLTTVMFNELNRAVINNLTIENAKITNNSKAILANSIKNGSVIANTHIVNSSINNNINSVGAFTGEIANSTIKESSALNIYISANNTIGGIAGQMSSGSIVENCYVTGTLRGTINHNLGARVGGITGWHSGTKINQVYTNVTIQANSRTGNGGIVGGPNGAHPTITNALSLGSGNASRISGFDVINNMQNVYEYAKSTSASNVKEGKNNVQVIENIYDKSFYKDILGFSEDIWNLNFLENEKLPILKNGPMPQTIEAYEIQENKNNIPNYKEIRLNESYQADKEILYYNLSKLMPFSDTKSWIEAANTYNQTSLLTTQKIKFIVSLNEKNQLVTGLEKNTLNTIKKIRIVYENQESETYDVEYLRNVENLVAIYQMKGMYLEYQFDNYIASINEELLNRVIDIANSLDYATQIANITSETESRLYVDFYNESVKANLADVIKQYILSNRNLPTYIDNKPIKEQIENSLTEENIIRLLYAYNYYEKWYHIDLDGIKISDLIFFNGQKLNEALSVDYLIQSIISTTSSNRDTNATVNFYNAILNEKIGMNLPSFIAYSFKTLNGYNDPSDWMVDHFEGILYEQPAIGEYADEIHYRVWTIMTKSNHYMILPILSAPQEDMYIISCPSQLVIGSMNRYPNYLNKDGNERTRMYNAIKEYAEYLGVFYGTSAGFIPNSADCINKIINIQFDTRFYFPASSKADAGTQEAGKTKDPVMKWVYEAIKSWAAANGSGAYANGTNVWWVVDSALSGIRAVHVFTHETAHNQDNRYFYAQNGRRPNTGAESHADGVIAQDIGETTKIFNLIRNFGLETTYATNLTPERINTEEKIDSYYREMYETKYVLEYLAGQAFLKLSPEEQAKVAVQMQHNTSGANYSTQYARLTADDFKKMNLKTMEDLWDNQLAIRATGSSPHTWNGRYGYDNFFYLHFYIPNNPNGAPDVDTFKNTGFEMLGYAGYDKGFITYMSGRSANDLIALQKITNDNTMTWKKYKLSRYENVEANLKNIKYYDLEELLALYERALKQDAQNGNLNTSIAVTKLYYGIVKRATNDFVTGGVYNVPAPISITSAEQFIEVLNKNSYGTYRIDADLDFSKITPENGKYYVTNRFLGILDGNGHKLKGVKYTLFNHMVYADVKNIVIEEPDYVEGVQSYLSVSAANCLIYNNNVTSSNVNLPNIKSKSGLMFTLKKNDITIKTFEINTVEDFLAIDNSDLNRGKKYILNNDLDFSNVTKENGVSIISNTFSGLIDGNGHKISNSKYVLFNSVTGVVKNLKVENSKITNNNAKGIFANTIANGTVENVTIHNSSIINNTNQVGGLSGAITSSTINKIALTDIRIQSSNTIGGLAGQINSTAVSNILVTGNIKGTMYHNLGSRVGGITGWLSDGASINNSVTKAEVNGTNRTGNGGIIGGPSSGNAIIINSISLSTGANSYRIAGFNTLNGVTNVYEHESSNSATNINGNNNSKVLLARSSDIINPDFYRNQVKLEDKVWNFDTVKTLGYPTLK